MFMKKGLLPYWREGIYEQLLWSIRDSLWDIFCLVNKSVNSWTCQHYLYTFIALKLIKMRIDAFCYWTFLTMAHWIRLSLLCRCKWTRKSQVSGQHVSEQNLFFYAHKRVYCVYTRNMGANLWLLLGAKSMPLGCMSMARVGAKYAEVGCKVYG